MFRWPSPLRTSPEIISPNDLVDEAFTAEDRIEEDLAIVGFAVINVEIQAAISSENPMRLPKPRQSRTAR